MAPHLDKIARRRLNEIGFDYDHGTGHGIGYFSGVHELPVGITSDNKIIF
jgi:Xaa-Pro aminopeptidase